jgi:hypothetical protein
MIILIVFIQIWHHEKSYLIVTWDRVFVNFSDQLPCEPFLSCGIMGEKRGEKRKIGLKERSE